MLTRENAGHRQIASCVVSTIVYELRKLIAEYQNTYEIFP